MKSVLRTLAVLLASASLSIAATAGWTSDWEGAKTRAKAENKPILIYLTGSDWCTWCMKMEKEVTSQKEFMDFVSAHFVLVEVDFPKKSEQPAELKKQNAMLKKEYLNGGYPTMYVLDSDGKKISEDFGELKAAPAEFVAKFKELLAGLKK